MAIERKTVEYVVITCDGMIGGEPCLFASTGDNEELARYKAARDGLCETNGKWLCDCNKHDPIIDERRQ